jgi:hypothetical protein
LALYTYVVTGVWEEHAAPIFIDLYPEDGSSTFPQIMNSNLPDYVATSIVRIIKSWRKIWASHVARMGEKRNAYRLLVGKPEG